MDDGRVDATEEVEITEVEKERKESEAGAYNPPTMGGRSTPHIRQWISTLHFSRNYLTIQVQQICWNDPLLKCGRLLSQPPPLRIEVE